VSNKIVDDKIAHYEQEIRSTLIYSIPLAVLAVIAPVLVYYSYFIPENEVLSVWFQRSGSLTVIFAVWFEYNLSKINEHINLSGIVIDEQQALSEKYSFRYKSAQYIGVVLAIMGTIIWGYGDLLVLLL